MYPRNLDHKITSLFFSFVFGFEKYEEVQSKYLVTRQNFSRLHGNLRRREDYGNDEKNTAVMDMVVSIKKYEYSEFFARKYIFVNLTNKKPTRLYFFGCCLMAG